MSGIAEIIALAWRILNIANIFFIIFVLFFERKEDSRRMAWLLAMIFLPGVGVILYILLSGHFFTHKKQLNKINSYGLEQHNQILENQQYFFQENRANIPNSVVKENLSLLDMNISQSKSLLATTDSIKVFCWGQDMFEFMKKDIEEAKESIHMESFIFHNDKTGNEILDLLCRKAREGLSVKLLYDDMGSLRTSTRFFNKLDNAGGMSLAFSPIRWRIPLTINFRNHRKITVIDGKIAYMGGVNIGDEYANCSKKSKKFLWRDTHIRITGSSVPVLQSVFMTDWFITPAWKTRLKKLDDITNYFPPSVFNSLNEKILNNLNNNLSDTIFGKDKIPTQILLSGPDDIQRTEIEDALIRMIMSAKKYVYIQTPYFIPTVQFTNAIKIAAYTGVDVRIMIPGTWDKWYVKAASFEFIRESMEYGVKFYHYNGFIHSKTFVTDDKLVTIGSTNIDTRSFVLHFEVNALFYDKKLAIENKEIFLKDIENCHLAEKNWFDSQFILRRAIWAFCKLFSSML